jgi:CBS domain containing-hemolysin-like protein
VGGLVLRRLGRIPAVGETVRLDNVVIEVLAVHTYGLKRLKIRVLEGGQPSS